MRNSKKLTALAIILIVVGIVGSIATTGTIKKVETITETMDDTDFSKVIVSSDNTSIDVLPTDEPNAKVEVTGFNLTKNFNTKIHEDTLIVKYKEKGIKFFNFS